MRRSKEFDESADDTGLDDLLNGRVAFFAEEFAELGGGLDLGVNLV